ncbi:MAG TPA: TonB-dependent receptor [Vicinamibacteria bacterium]|jgi:vitamin B12 transporter|nr:TonB-dependent receptor [Vicinamibacteria bacterium]
MRVSVLGLFLFSSVQAAAGASEGLSTITVRVVDPQVVPVRGARVTLYTRDDRLRINAVTDAAGLCRFESLPAADYLVEAAASGFGRPDVQRVALVKATEVDVEFALKLAGLREQVVVTASGSMQGSDEVSKAIAVVDREQIDGRDEFALADALRTVAGLRVQQLGGPGSFASIKIRGLRDQDTAILIDGVRFRDAAGPQADASGFLEDLLVTNIERVEVLRGSGSSLYGSNAIGGVVNVVTDHGGGQARGGLLLEGGSLGFFRGRADTAGGFNKDRITYSAGFAHLNVSEGVGGDDKARTSSIQGRVQVRLGPTATLATRIYFADSFTKLNESPLTLGTLPSDGIIDASPLSRSELSRYESGTPVSELNLDGANFIPSAHDPDNTRSANFLSALVTFEHRPSPGFAYSVTYHGLLTNRTFVNGPLGPGFQPDGMTRDEFDGRVHTLDAHADFGVGPHHLFTVGYQLESERYLGRSTPTDPAAGSSVNAAQLSHASFIQDQIRLLGGALQASAGLRAQWFSLDAPTLTPASGSPFQGLHLPSLPSAYTADGSIAYFLEKTGTKLRGHVGNGYRAPSLFERFGSSFGSFGYSVYGDPRLGPERSLGVDLGVDQQFAAGRLRTSLTLFRTDLRKVIIFDFSGAISPETDPFGRFGGYRLVDGGKAQGLEVEAAAEPLRGLRLNAAYTYNAAEPPTRQPQDLPQAYIIPKHQFSLVATQRLGGFQATLALAASDSYLAPVLDPVTFASRTYRFQGIVKADFVASYSMRVSERGSLRLFGKVADVFHRTYFESGFATPGRVALGGVAFAY